MWLCMHLLSIPYLGTFFALFSSKKMKGPEEMKHLHYIVLTIAFEREGDLWLASCEELGTAIQAKTLDEATESIHEAVVFHLNALEEENQREKFFEENGITVFAAKPPTTIQKTVRVSIPENSQILMQTYSVPVPCYS